MFKYTILKINFNLNYKCIVEKKVVIIKLIFFLAPRISKEICNLITQDSFQINLITTRWIHYRPYLILSRPNCFLLSQIRNLTFLTWANLPKIKMDLSEHSNFMNFNNRGKIRIYKTTLIFQTIKISFTNIIYQLVTRLRLTKSYKNQESLPLN
jgi:hypothetical protein